MNQSRGKRRCKGDGGSGADAKTDFQRAPAPEPALQRGVRDPPAVQRQGGKQVKQHQNRARMNELCRDARGEQMKMRRRGGADRTGKIARRARGGDQHDLYGAQ